MSRALPRVRAYCYVTADANGLAVPVGMLLTYSKYPWLLNHGVRSTYIWFLAAAPDCAQTAAMIVSPVSTGRALLDAGFVESVRDNNGGRIGLHADPNGGKLLLKFYEEYCGLSRLPANKLLPLGPVSVMQALQNQGLNDGRYFTGSEMQAKSFLYPWKMLR